MFDKTRRYPEPKGVEFDDLYRKIVENDTISSGNEVDVVSCLRDKNPRGKFMDVACGTGQYISQWAQKYPERCFVGVDNDAKSLEFARVNFGHLNNLKFITCGVEELRDQFEHDFSGVISVAALHHFDDLNSAIENMAGCLGYKGIIFLTDLDRSLFLNERMELPRKVMSQMHGFLRRQDYDGLKGYLIRSGNIKDPRILSYFSFQAAHTAEEVTKIFEKKGMSVNYKLNVDEGKFNLAAYYLH